MAAASAFVLSGCAIGGAKGEVGQAIENFDKLVKTSVIEGEFTVDGGPGKSMEMKLAFVLDRTDPAGPKSSISMDVSGVESMSLSFVQIGQSLYITTQGRTAQVDIPQGAADGLGKQFGSEMQGQLMKAVSAMVKDVQKTASGPGDEALTTYHAYVDVGKMCDGLFNTLLPGIQQSIGNGATGGTGSGFDMGGALAGGCEKIFSGNPQLWFGVGADKTLRMLSFQARLAAGGQGAAVDFSGRFDVTRANQPVNIVAPQGAVKISDPSALFGS